MKQKIQQEIAKFLTEQGFLVQTDYGYSNFKVDVAVLKDAKDFSLWNYHKKGIIVFESCS